ncbi:hypothetical protein STEG23_029599 [Scotinomys teguina]
MSEPGTERSLVPFMVPPGNAYVGEPQMLSPQAENTASDPRSTESRLERRASVGFSTPVRLPQPTGHSQVHLRTGYEEEEEEEMTLENHKYGPILSDEAPGKNSRRQRGAAPTTLHRVERPPASALQGPVPRTHRSCSPGFFSPASNDPPRKTVASGTESRVHDWRYWRPLSHTQAKACRPACAHALPRRTQPECPVTFSKFTCIPERPSGRSGPGRSESLAVGRARDPTAQGDDDDKLPKDHCLSFDIMNPRFISFSTAQKFLHLEIELKTQNGATVKRYPRAGEGTSLSSPS